MTNISITNIDGDTPEYTMIRMIHQMAGSLAITKKDNWQLSRTATFEHYVLTVWTNGIVDVGAETHKDYEGVETHRYFIKDASK